jgi:hypothetical protein
MAVTIRNGIRESLKGLLGCHNDVDEGGDDYHLENQLDALLERTLSIQLDPSTNALVNTTKRHVFVARWPVEIVEVEYVPDGTLTVNATNYALISLYKGTGAAAAATTVASINTSTGSNFAAGTPFAATLTSTAANKKLATTESLAAEILKYGAGGVAVPKGAWIIHYRLQ